MRKPQEDWRIIRTVRRLLQELAWVRIEGIALRELEKGHSIGLDFFRVAHTALRGDRLLRLVRIFEDRRDVASFWYVYRCRSKAIRPILERSDVTVRSLQSLSTKLKLIRDKTFVHIDKDGVWDPAQLYRAAGVKGKEVHQAVNAVWRALRKLEREMGETPLQVGRYSGKDIRTLFKARDSYSRGSITKEHQSRE